jgi:hypothetical protein
MSNDSRNVVAVLIVCAMLVLAFIAVPVGVGALLFVRLQHTEQAAAAQREALAAEQRARLQAEMARMAAELESQRLQTAAASQPAAPLRPPSRELTLQERQTIYLQLKFLRDQLAGLDALGADDPTLKDLVVQGKAQVDASFNQIATAAGITRQQLDEIMAEGDREKW